MDARGFFPDQSLKFRSFQRSILPFRQIAAAGLMQGACIMQANSEKLHSRFGRCGFSAVIPVDQIILFFVEQKRSYENDILEKRISLGCRTLKEDREWKQKKTGNLSGIPYMKRMQRTIGNFLTPQRNITG